MKFSEMTWPILKEVSRTDTVVIAPIAACEQHSRHLPTYTDTILVTAVAEGVEMRLAESVLLLPTLWFGASGHHLPFGATLSASVQTHVTMLCELLTPLLDDGYRRVMILNGHGGNIDTLHLALRSLKLKYRSCLLTGASYWELAERELSEIAEGPRRTMGHACELETSMILALRPELVRKEEIRNDYREQDSVLRGLFVAPDFGQLTNAGAVGFPEFATAEKGRRFLEAAIGRTVEVVQGILSSPLPE